MSEVGAFGSSVSKVAQQKYVGAILTEMIVRIFTKYTLFGIISMVEYFGKNLRQVSSKCG